MAIFGKLAEQCTFDLSKTLLNMPVQLTLFAYLHLVAVIFGVLVSAILWNYARTPRLAMNKWLGASIFSLSCGLLIAFLATSGIAFDFPHVYRVGNIFALAYIPFSYLYFRRAVAQRAPGKWDLLHSLPILFYVIDFLPFFLLPASAKLEIFRNDMADINRALSFDVGWMTPPYFQLAVRTLQFAVYWCFEVALLRRIYRLHISVLEHENKFWLRWATMYIGIQSLLFLPYFFVILFAQWSHFYTATNVFASIVLVFSTLILFFRPNILYGIKGLIIYEETPHATTDNASPKAGVAAGVYLDYGTVKNLQGQLDTLMQTMMPFLRHGYSSADLANDLAIPPYQLSAFLNHGVGYNFNDYINEQRIRFCLEQINSGAWKEFTLEAIGFECGFRNRNTFTASFKKFVGQAPSVYLSRWEKFDLPKN
jgi:AraC-like DNA-binding protein